MLRIISALFCLCLLAAPAMAAEAEYYIGPRDGADIYNRPDSRADKIAHLKRLTVVRVVDKQRTWWRIESSGISPSVRGWVTAGAIRQRYQPSTASRKSSSFFSGFASMFGYGRTSNNEKTAVLGVRGLDEETTARAGGRGNTSAVKWMDTLSVSQKEVDKFIRDGDLNP
jgi:hypothetical protein